MADLYHSAVTQVLTSGAAVAISHNLVADGAAVAPDNVEATFLHGVSVGASTVRITNKGTATYSVVLDQENNPAGAPSAVSVRLDAVYWHSREGRG